MSRLCFQQTEQVSQRIDNSRLRRRITLKGGRHPSQPNSEYLRSAPMKVCNDRDNTMATITTRQSVDRGPERRGRRRLLVGLAAALVVLTACGSNNDTAQTAQPTPEQQEQLDKMPPLDLDRPTTTTDTADGSAREVDAEPPPPATAKAFVWPEALGLFVLEDQYEQARSYPAAEGARSATYVVKVPARCLSDDLFTPEGAMRIIAQLDASVVWFGPDTEDAAQALTEPGPRMQGALNIPGAGTGIVEAPKGVNSEPETETTWAKVGPFSNGRTQDVFEVRRRRDSQLVIVAGDSNRTANGTQWEENVKGCQDPGFAEKMSTPIEAWEQAVRLLDDLSG